MKTLILKPILSIMLIASFSAQSFAASVGKEPSFACEEAYAKRLIQVDQPVTDNPRTAMTLGFLGFAFTEGILLNTSIVFANGMYITSPITMALTLGLVGTGLYLQDKENSYVMAREMIRESFVDRETIIDAQEEVFKSVQLSQTEYNLNTKINPLRIKNGESPLVLEEYLEINPLPLFNRALAKTAIDETVARINRGRKVKVTYEEVAATIKSLTSDDTFCPEGKIKGKRNLSRIVGQYL